ncbi:MAG: beta-ketoacyl-ACP synthase II [Alphaproteobacteria bacterium]|jgi:3-oxoacyl-[acyl-carrier-protein] synthase II|nr:beta-ketoacyl-ACP synthase II [Alphaproteobacteria bacterium]MCV6599083.1 beta-ketoacyl-ACP synthase II [Alphaproteobacteria bacterium]
MKRVVITGLGTVSALGVGTDYVWNRLVKGESGIKNMNEKFDASDLTSQVAGIVPRGEGEGEFNLEDYIPRKDTKKMDDFIIYGIAAAREAVKDSGWVAETDEQKERTGVMVGSGIGGLERIHDTAIAMNAKGPRRVSPFFIPACLINLVSGHISIEHGFKGPNHSAVTACATGTHAIADAARVIACGEADVIVAGGAESSVCKLAVAGFASAKALSTSYNDTPETASRPFDKSRDGFVIAEGAGVVVLEELEHALARGAKIYGEVAGWGYSGDAYHMTSPAPGGEGGYRAMKAAVAKAEINPADIDYINTHGTSTPTGDGLEITAIKKLLGDNAGKVSISSTKSMLGHSLGATGAMEAIFCLKAMENSIVPPTINLKDPDDFAEGLDLTPNVAKERNIDIALSNSFGFGGTNATLIFKKYQG